MLETSSNTFNPSDFDIVDINRSKGLFTLRNGTKVKGLTNQEAHELIEVVRKHQILFSAPGFINIPESEQILIELVPSWEEKIEFNSRVYPISPTGQYLINKTFNKLRNSSQTTLGT